MSYLFEVGERRFEAKKGSVVIIPGGCVHAFRNIGRMPARQFIVITPTLDAVAFFTELAAVKRNGAPDRAGLSAFGAKWQVEFLGPPI